jgi:hypothetical protein
LTRAKDVQVVAGRVGTIARIRGGEMTPTYSQRELPNGRRIRIPPAEGFMLGRYHVAPHRTDI